MSRIRILDEDVSNRIAAGEVVERPASMVKELVENSLDAGARRISIQVEHGGRSLVRVMDDGCGMDREDALLCLEAHATSKIKCAADIEAIHTLGFRGEAIPSIAAVTRFQLRTRVPEANEGTEVLVDGGVVKSVSSVGMAPGTTVTARSLFFNLPVRRKFLRSIPTEEAQIQETALLLALAHPTVGFELSFDGRPIFAVPPGNDRRTRAAMLLGRETVEQMLLVAHHEADYEITGLVARPGLTRATRREQRTFVNTRPIDSDVLLYAVRDAYHTLVMKGRYPPVLLFVTLPADQVDVNVHPAKREVRFRDPRELGHVCGTAIRRALQQLVADPWRARAPAPTNRTDGTDRADGTAAAGVAGTAAAGASTAGAAAAETVAAATSPATAPSASSPSSPSPSSFPSAPLHAPSPSRPAHPPSPAAPLALEAPTPPPSLWPAGLPPTHPTRRPTVAPTSSTPPAPGAPPCAAASGTAPPPSSTPPAGTSVSAADREDLKHLRLLGAISDLFLVAEGPQGLVLIDQHAAHERVHFELLLRHAQQRDGTGQGLLIPVTVEFAAPAAALLRQHLAQLNRLGFAIEPFGGNSFLVTAVPPHFPQENLSGLLHDLLDDLRDLPLGQRRADEATIARAACKASVKAHDPLRPEEVARLLADLAETQLPYTCPHGRPTLINISYAELEKRFGRRH